MSMTEQHSVSNKTHHAGFEDLVLQLSQCFFNIPLEGLDAAIIRAMRLVSEYCHADRAVIYSCDWDSLTASHLFEWDSNPEYYIGNRLKTLRLPEFEDGFKLPADGQLYSRSSSEEHPDNIILRQLTEEPDIRALCAFPIIMGGRTTGITVFSTADRMKEWARNELTAVQIFANILSCILTRRAQETAFAETRRSKSGAIILRQNKILKSINMIYEKALACETAGELGAACLDIIESITACKASFIGEVGKDGVLHAIAMRDPGWGLCDLYETVQKSLLSDIKVIRLYRGILKNGKSLLINGIATLSISEGNQAENPAITSFLGVPFIRDNRVAGLLAAANRTGGFGKYDRETLEAVAPTVFEVLLRKSAEETVKENEFLMRTIMDSTASFIFIKDKDSRVIMVNQAYCKAFGVDMHDVIGKNDYELYLTLETAENSIKNDQYVMQTGETLSCEESAMTADGLKTYLLTKVPWRDSNGSLLGILGIAHDITELKKAEASLQELVATLKHSKDYINILYETTGKILSSTTPRKEITELCTKVMTFLDCQVFFNYLVEDNQTALRLNACGGVSDEQKAALDNLPLGIAICGCAIRDGCRAIAEHIQTTPDPRTEFLKTIGIRAYVCHPLMSDGKAIGGLAFGTKTRDRFSEEDLMLMKTVAESTAVAIRRKKNEETLLKQAEDLLIADHNRNEFLSTLSHELRNPMATIMAALSLLNLSEDKHQQEKAKQIMQRQTEYLCRLVDDLLDITRITRNKVELKKERYELNKAAAAIAVDIKALFEAKGVHLVCIIGPESIYINADPVRVKQAIGNLLHNALKFSYNGSTVTLSVFTENNHACISVKDSGIGIDPTFMDTIFEPFSQADKSIDRKNGGLGLGLSIVQGIAELHGGSVSARSEGPESGAEFTLCLPLG